MRVCRDCKEEKPFSEFYPKRRKHAKDGFNSICIQCARIGAARWAKENRERHGATTKAWVALNPRKHAASVAKWASNNKQARRTANSAWRLKNPGLSIARGAQRRASQRMAAPIWANRFFLAEAYRLAALRTRTTGFSWHVDHIVPLNSQLVCGLHVEANVEVIPGVENLSKGNRYWPNMP